jgi:peptidoglycan/xylan/chitin deacetylase (PgdA/CDA1 family)
MSRSSSSPLGTQRVIKLDHANYPKVGSNIGGRPLPLKEFEVILTFDDGPTLPCTEIVLEALSAESTLATFFFVGYRAHRLPSVVKKVADSRHTIGSHTELHQYLPRLSVSEQRNAIDTGNLSINTALGSTNSTLPFFRFPYFAGTDEMLTYLESRKVIVWGADAETGDWKLEASDDIVIQAVERLQKSKGGILMLHDVQLKTALALPALLNELKTHKFKIVHVQQSDT